MAMTAKITKLTTSKSSLEVRNIGSARHFLADKDVQPKEGMKAVEKQLVCVSLSFVTNKLHGTMQDEESSEKEVQRIYIYNCF